MFVLVLPRVSSRVSGFPVASPCLWGKLENISYPNVSKQVVMSFCVAGMVLCDIPTCLITCRKYQNWRKEVSHEMFVFLRPRVSSRVSGFPVASPCLSSALHTLHFTLHNLHFRLYTPHFTLLTPHSTLYTSHSTLYTPHSTLHTLHSSLHTAHFTLHTPHFPLHTPHSTLYTPHFTLLTPHLHSTLYTPHSTL